MSGNSDPLTDENALRSMYAEPAKAVREKSFPRLDKHSRHYIGLSPFLCIGSSHPDGLADVSPRGGEPGFVHVADDRHLALPDRPGNNRLDTLTNIVHHPAVGLLFFLPGVEDMLRVNGIASITTDPEIMKRFRHDGKLPRSVSVIETREVYFHCTKALRRSDLWNPDKRLPKGARPRIRSRRSRQSSRAIFAVTGKPAPGGADRNTGVRSRLHQRYRIVQVRTKHGHSLRGLYASYLPPSILRHGDLPCPKEDRSADRFRAAAQPTGNGRIPSLT